MANGIKIKVDSKAVMAILNSPEVQAEIQRSVDRVTNAANSMYGASGYKGDVIKTDRPHGAVYPADIYSKRSNAKHNTLLKALSAGRG